MKLWQKDGSVAEAVERFTTGRDREMDMLLAEHDVQGSLAHLAMLAQTGLVPAEEAELLRQHLLEIGEEVKAGRFVLEPGVEDVHSQVELLLTRRCGDAGRTRVDENFTQRVMADKTDRLYRELLASKGWSRAA